MKHLLFSIAAVLLLMTSCERGLVFDQKIPLSPEGWRYADTLDFSFNLADTAASYALLLDIEHAPEFPFQNVYVQLHTTFPDGKRLSQVASFDLFDTKGNPNGKCSGEHCKVGLLLQEKTRFNQIGAYRLTLEQYTRQEVLPGIQSIRFSVKKQD